MTSSGEEPLEGETGSGIVRRRMLQLLGAAGTTVGIAGSATGDPEKNGSAGGSGSGTTGDGASSKIARRLKAEFQRRKRNAQRQFQRSDDSPHASNGRLRDDAVITKFGKSLAHDDETGLPTPEAYDSLVRATETGGEAVAYDDRQGSGSDTIQQADLDPEADDIEPSELIEEDPSPKPLVQPETAWSYLADGASTAGLRIAVPPAFDDPETGAEMVELYWRALTRDVKFRNYDSDSAVFDAANELDGLDAYNGPGADSEVTPANVFRGVTPGCETGPYVSQFLLKDRFLGGGPEDQKIQPQVSETTPSDYMTTDEDWLKVQKGVVPPMDDSLPGNEFSPDRRYIITGRDMCERVHDDPPFRQVQKAAQVLIFSMNVPLDEGIPYTLKPFDKPDVDDDEELNRFLNARRNIDQFTGQATLPFNDFGPLFIEKKLLEATEHGQKAAWHKKWNVHRRLRPEEYGGRVEAAKGETLRPTSPEGVDYEELIPDNLLESEALERTKDRYGSYLLPQAYAEGSPTHPSYPAGHSVVAGAGVTVLKAFFDGDYVFPEDEKVVPSSDGKKLFTAEELPTTYEAENRIVTLDGDEQDIDETLTVRGELNKLASNMALGRNRAGIHYRTDGIEGLRLGEQAAIRFLQDQLALPVRTGETTLTLETFDGESVTIEPTVTGSGEPSRPQ